MRHILLIFSLLALSFSAKAVEVDSLSLSPAAEHEQVESQEVHIAADSLWDQANTAYINSNFDYAVELYSAIEERGLISDKLFFNLGNAHYKRDDLARAILYYQKALQIAPSDEDIVYNLGVAQSQIKDQIDVVPEFFMRKWSRSIGRMFSCTGWTILSLIALVAFLTSLLFFFLSASISLRKIFFGVGLFAVLIGSISTLYALEDRRALLDHNSAVVMSRSISIKSSPDRSATDLFMLHSGTTVRILRQMDAWCEIVIDDGKKGWIEESRIERI